jgi:hypothetical protein
MWQNKFPEKNGKMAMNINNMVTLGDPKFVKTTRSSSNTTK